MTDKELKKLSRQQILEMMIQQTRQFEKDRDEAAAKEKQLTEENSRLRAQLDDREIKIAKAGSLAEAAMAINGVMEAAQKAAEQYLLNVQRAVGGENVSVELPKISGNISISESELKLRETERICKEKLEETNRICKEKIEQTDQYCKTKEEEAEKVVKEAYAVTRERLTEYWDELNGRLLLLYDRFPEMKQLMMDQNMETSLTRDMMISIMSGKAGVKKNEKA